MICRRCNSTNVKNWKGWELCDNCGYRYHTESQRSPDSDESPKQKLTNKGCNQKIIEC